MPFTVRDFQSADFEALWRIDQDCFPSGISYSRAELKAYIRRHGSLTLVALNIADPAASPDPGRSEKYFPASPSLAAPIAGFIVAEAGSPASGHIITGHIITIDVLAAARRSGVGSLLLGRAEDRLLAAGCRSVGLETAVDNISALSFYKRQGYSVIRTFPRYYSNGVDALLLRKDLIPQPRDQAPIRN
ncbi:MAG: N-acetyltransferase [Candidatus Sulfotelmatobacter sp.]